MLRSKAGLPSLLTRHQSSQGQRPHPPALNQSTAKVKCPPPQPGPQGRNPTSAATTNVDQENHGRPQAESRGRSGDKKPPLGPTTKRHPK